MEIVPGMALPEWRVAEVSADKMKLFCAIARDPNPIHRDRAEVARLGLGDRLINEGPINLGFVVNMLETWAGHGCLRELVTRYKAPVYEGDTVVASGTVTAVRESGGERVADCEVWLDRQDGTRAVAGTAIVGFALSSPEPATPTGAQATGDVTR